MVLWFFPIPFLAKCVVREIGDKIPRCRNYGLFNFLQYQQAEWQLRTGRNVPHWLSSASCEPDSYSTWNKCFLWNHSAGQGDIKHLLLLPSNTSPTRRDHLRVTPPARFWFFVFFFPVEMLLFEEEEPALNNSFCSYLAGFYLSILLFSMQVFWLACV